MQIFTASFHHSAVNCSWYFHFAYIFSFQMYYIVGSDHLPFPWGWCRRVGWVGSKTNRVGVEALE